MARIPKSKKTEICTTNEPEGKAKVKKENFYTHSNAQNVM